MTRPTDVDDLDYRRMFEQAPSPYLIMTADFTIVTVNTAYAEATMIDRDAVAGRYMFDIFPDNPDDPNADGVRNLRRSLQAVVETRRPDAMPAQRYDVRTEDGGFVLRYWSPVNTPVLRDDGSVAFIIHRVQDVTDLVEARRHDHDHDRDERTEVLRTRVEQMEADLFTRAGDLQRANRELREVNDELAAATAELRAQQEAKDRFIAVLSHELRNPLAAARAALDVLALDVAGHPASAVLDRQLTALTRLTDDLLDAARLVSGRQRVVRRPLDLADLVEAGVQDVAAAHPDRAAPAVTVPATPTIVTGDQVRLVQMIANLVDNTYKHTPPGTTVTVDLDVVGAQARLCVRDAGPGFPATAGPRLFEMFTRAVVGDQAPAGLGLGLAVVRGIVELHDGTVTAHSDGPGHGAAFTVHVPLADAPHRDSAPPPTGPGRSPLRILLIDDNADLADMYRRLLERHGDTVTVATTAVDALRVAGRGTFDLILCDLVLGDDLNGYDVVARLRSSDLHRHTRIVAVSGHSQDADRRASRAAGFDAHLAKPLQLEQLDRLLEAWTAAGDRLS
ncbi:ATP-binding protein [Dactylosporangium siamense]|uniref:histidine kinase n=1 Tax=Dactylosporangium siamense TaxID=685454 RepID=A0A919PIQ0_9ACTN|nr:ATP-binding protein [Dactylosporangium siamense]GIG43956.1 hypothetical protein Dsi01nite_019970 [Dactylosporangium siamense]